MAIYVDETRQYPIDTSHFSLWCHMWTDGPIEELHQMAQRIGMKRKWFQNHPEHPHHDLKPAKKQLALENGAIQSTSREWVKIIKAKRELERK